MGYRHIPQSLSDPAPCEAPSEMQSALLSQERTKMNNHDIPHRVTIVLLILAAAMCAYGIFRGEMNDVLRKAINICMECIGIG